MKINNNDLLLNFFLSQPDKTFFKFIDKTRLKETLPYFIKNFSRFHQSKKLNTKKDLYKLDFDTLDEFCGLNVVVNGIASESNTDVNIKTGLNKRVFSEKNGIFKMPAQTSIAEYQL